jgi:UDP:flavonoid glycosyltransferase YjiC (YdhE family)
MRATLIAIGSRGDVNPYVALGQGLRDAGHKVTVATHDRYSTIVTEHGLDFAPVAEGAVSRGVDTEEGRKWIDRSRVLPSWVGALKDGASVAKRRLADCWDATSETDLVVVSLFATLLGIQVHQERGTPLVRAYCAPVAWTAGPVARNVLWRSQRRWVNSARNALGLAPMPGREPYRALDTERVPVLCAYSAAVSPPEPTWGDWIHVTGYWMLRQAEEWTPPPALETFLAAGPPPVLVSFGAMADRDRSATTRLLVEALEQTGQRGIIVQDTAGQTPEALSSTVIACGFVPHDWVLPRVVAAVHHGGANTLARCLYAGVPSVVVPFFGDQPYWAARVRELGVGPDPIPRRRLSSTRLADAIRVAVTDRNMRQRVAALAARLETENGVAAAVALLEDHVSGNTRIPPAHAGDSRQ